MERVTCLSTAGNPERLFSSTFTESFALRGSDPLLDLRGYLLFEFSRARVQGCDELLGDADLALVALCLFTDLLEGGGGLGGAM